MKKFASGIAVVLSMLLLCTSGFAADVERTDAYTAYKRAMKKLGEAATIQTTAEYRLRELESGYVYEDDDIKANITLTQTQSAGKSLQMEARMSVEDEGDFIYAYYNDGYYYQRILVETPGLKRKTKMSERQAIAECFGIDRNLGPEAFQFAELEQTYDGYTLKYKVAGKDFSGMYINAMAAYYNDEDIPYTIKTGDITYTLALGKDGALKSYKISFVTRFDDHEDEDVYRFYISNKVDCTVTTDSNAKEIKYPENLDAYREIKI